MGLFVRPKSLEVQAAEILSKSNDRFAEKLESISREGLKSKDRVDIQLDEYLRMTEELKNTTRALKHARMLLTTIGIPPELISAIESDSIRVESYEDLRDFKRHYRVRFSIDTSRFI